MTPSLQQRHKAAGLLFGPLFDYVGQQYCCVPGCDNPSGPPHHVLFRSQGGLDWFVHHRGATAQGDAVWLVGNLAPMCVGCHERLHWFGSNEAFEAEQLGLELVVVAREHGQKFELLRPDVYDQILQRAA